MASDLNESTSFNVSIKTLLGIGFAMATIISMWFILQADIEEAKNLPSPLPPDVTRMEYLRGPAGCQGSLHLRHPGNDCIPGRLG